MQSSYIYFFLESLENHQNLIKIRYLSFVATEEKAEVNNRELSGNRSI